MEEEEETPNEESKKLFDAILKGDEELVKVLLGKENKQFKLDLNFQFKKMVFFWNLFSSLFSFFFIFLSPPFFSNFFLLSLDGLSFTLLLSLEKKELWRFLLDMDPMLIFKIKFWFDFYFFWKRVVWELFCFILLTTSFCEGRMDRSSLCC